MLLCLWLFCNEIWKTVRWNKQSQKLLNCENLQATAAIINAVHSLTYFLMVSKISKEMKNHHFAAKCVCSEQREQLRSKTLRHYLISQLPETMQVILFC